MPKFWQKLLWDVFTFSLFVLSLYKDFSSQSGDTNFVLVLPMKWEQPNTMESCISMIRINRGNGFLYQTDREGGKSKQTERQRKRERVCASVGWRRWKHRSTSTNKRGTETHLLIIDGRQLWLISTNVLGTFANEVSHGLIFSSQQQFEQRQMVFYNS